MKVNLNGTTPDPVITQQGNKCAAHSDRLSHAPAEDKTTLSLDHDGIAALTSQAMATAETRQAKIEALRQAISSGQYKVEPDKVAESILAESVKPERSS